MAITGTPPNQPVVFSTGSYRYIAEALCATTGYTLGEVVRDTFTDGEHYYRIETDVDHKKAVLIGGSISDEDTLEMYDLASALVDNGARSLHLIIPFFGYSTMERAVKAGEVVTAKNRARLFSSIPKAHYGNHIYLFDLHTEGLPYYFENGVQTHHIYCKPLIIEACRELAGKDFVLASTDAGRAKWVESLANDMGVQAAFVLKRRGGKDETEITTINADVIDKDVVIYDDMIRSGSSIISAAKAYKTARAARIFVVTSHGLFVGNGLEKMEQSGLFECVVSTNTHAAVQSINNPFLKVKSIIPLIEGHLR